MKAATRPFVYAAEDVEISIHAAREGGDKQLNKVDGNDSDFNPRRP